MVGIAIHDATNVKAGTLLRMKILFLSGELTILNILAKNRYTASIVVKIHALRTTSAPWCARNLVASNAPTPAVKITVRHLVLLARNLAHGKSVESFVPSSLLIDDHDVVKQEMFTPFLSRLLWIGNYALFFHHSIS